MCMWAWVCVHELQKCASFLGFNVVVVLVFVSHSFEIFMYELCRFVSSFIYAPFVLRNKMAQRKWKHWLGIEGEMKYIIFFLLFLYIYCWISNEKIWFLKCFIATAWAIWIANKTLKSTNFNHNKSIKITLCAKSATTPKQNLIYSNGSNHIVWWILAINQESDDW